MSYLYYPKVRINGSGHRVPWLFLFAFFALFIVFHWPLELRTTVSDYNVSQEVAIAGGADAAVRPGALIVLGLAAIVSLTTRRSDPRFRIDGLLGWLLIAFVAWALISPVWAWDVPLTLKRLSSFLLLCLVGIAIARRLSLHQILLWTFYTTLLFLLVAIAAEIATGMFQPFASGYRFSGVQHPNAEGVECGLLAFSGLVAAHIEKRRRKFYITAALAGLFFLVLSASRTTLASTGLAVAIYFVAVSGRRVKALLWPVCGGVVSALLLLGLAGSFQGLESKLFPGRDAGGGVESFAGRSQVWADLVPYIVEHPVVGYGYGGFWKPSVVTLISDKEQWSVPDGHSTYVDYLLALGSVGLLLDVLCLGVGVQRVFKYHTRTRDSHYAFLAGIIIFGVVDGLLESSAGEVSLLACLSIVALVRLAFVPPVKTHDVLPIDRAPREQLCLA